MSEERAAKTYSQYVNTLIVSRKALEVGLAESCRFRYISFQEPEFAFLERPIFDDVPAEFKKYVFVACQIYERLLLTTVFN